MPAQLRFGAVNIPPNAVDEQYSASSGARKVQTPAQLATVLGMSVHEAGHPMFSVPVGLHTPEHVLNV